MNSERDDERAPATPGHPAIDEKIEAQLGEKLREAFSDVLSEPIPDRFRQLIQSLSEGDDR